MSHRVFAPDAFGRAGVTPTVGLRTPLYVIRGTFRHPVTSAVTPLPSHHWVLGNAASHRAVVIGGVSDAKGVSVVNAPMPPLGPGPFFLLFVPAPVNVRNQMIDDDEAWIDLDTGDWVVKTDIRKSIERGNLHRIGAWHTAFKAGRLGGFSDWPPEASPASRETGRLDITDIVGKPYGSITEPWQMQIDHGWTRVAVRFFYFDWERNKQAILPPGLVVDAVPSGTDHAGDRLGAGTAVTSGDGTIRMTLSGAPYIWAAIDFAFSLEAVSLRVDLATPEPPPGTQDRRLGDSSAPAQRHERNDIPNIWHSLDQRARLSSPSKAYGATALRWAMGRALLAGDQANDVTIEFHLDDVTLVDETGGTLNVAGRVTLFDHFMTLMDPLPVRPHLSDCILEHSWLPASSAYRVGRAIPPWRRRLHCSTRLVHHEGRLFDLQDLRVAGTPGQTPRLGARCAMLDAHPLVRHRKGNPHLENEGFYEIHVIRAEGVSDPSSGLPLTHVLLFVSCRVDEGSLSAASVDRFYANLTTAAERWSQGSPGIPSPTKDYRIVAQDPSARDRMFRVRAYFGQIFEGFPILNIQLRAGDDRSSTRDRYWWLGFDTATIKYYEEAAVADALGNGGWGRDSDGVTATRHTLAHEFGHVFGLPDEYAESLEPDSVDPAASWTHPFVPDMTSPSEGMPTDYRPFYSDGSSMMKSNQLPRLRHYQHHVLSLNHDTSFETLRGRPFVVRHETLGSSGIEYVRPLNQRKHPYVAEFDGKVIPGGRGDCALFPVGPDEGVAEAMFARPGTTTPTTLAVTDRFDGILVVRSRVCFRFDASVSPPDRWAIIWQDFMQSLYDGAYRSRARFAAVGGTTLKRIGIFIQPHCFVRWNLSNIELDFGGAPSAVDPFTIVPLDFRLKLGRAQFKPACVFRAILGVPTSKAGSPGGATRVANGDPLEPADFANVAHVVESHFGDPAGARTIVAV